MDEYTRKYGARSTSRPECYGDVDTYDPADLVCEDCNIRRACKLTVDKELQRITQGPRGRTRQRSRERKRRYDELNRNSGRDEIEEDETFLGALVYNGTLSAGMSLLREAHHAIDSIPLIKYPNPLLNYRRHMRRRREQEKDEETE